MKSTASLAKERKIKDLQDQVAVLRSELKKANKISAANESITVRVLKTQAHVQRIRDPHGPDVVIGKFALRVEVTAAKDVVYIPTSIASGKKTTGFVYQIEGTAQGTLSTASISCAGEGVTQVTLGTIVYSKIPKEVTATFRIQIEMRGKVGKTYKVVVSRIHYKRNPSDGRYERYLGEIPSEALKFR